jgi:hypothetical protein
VRLVLEPTRSVTGRVDLAGGPGTRVNVAASTADDPTGTFYLVAPVTADGSFAVAGATTGELWLGTSIHGNGEYDERIEFQTLPASPAPITGIVLRIAASTRTVDVVVRSAVSTSLDGAQVVLLAGKQSIANLGELLRSQSKGVQTHFAAPVVGENVPRAVLDKIRPGDLVAHIEHARPGDLTACATSFPGDLLDPGLRKRVQTHLRELAVKCEHLGPTTSFVVLSTPPQQRID